jgi:hypothetical protein
MPSTRETAQKYIDFIAALKFTEAFEMLASDAKYHHRQDPVVQGPIAARIC